MKITQNSLKNLVDKQAKLREENQTFDGSHALLGSLVGEKEDLETAIQEGTPKELAKRAAINAGLAVFPDHLAASVASAFAGPETDALTHNFMQGILIDAVDIPVKGVDAVASAVAAAVKGVSMLLGNDD